MSVLYGDTDSVFVYAAGENLSSRGDVLAEELNTHLTQTIWESYHVHSRIAIRCDVAYRAFLLPRLRGATADETIRGRAKGYAGLVKGDGGPTSGSGSPGRGTDGSSTAGSARLDIKGMEAARSDYTPLAQRFQRELLELLFNDAGVDSIVGFVRDRVSRLQQGHLDDELVYRKILRRPAEDYRHAVPPQVRAARMLGWTTRRGRIDYVMTTAGPEPVKMRSADFDYRHYIDHQLRPIWLSIAEAADLGDSLSGNLLGDGTDEPGSAGLSLMPRLQDYRPLDDQLELGL